MQKQNDTMTAINAEEPRSHNNPSIKIDTGLKWGNGEMRLAVDSSQSSYSVPSGIHQKRYTRTTQLPPIHQNWYIPEPQKIQQGNVWISKETILRFKIKDTDKPRKTLDFRPWGAGRGGFQVHFSTHLWFRYRSVDWYVFQSRLTKTILGILCHTPASTLG